LVQTIDTCSFMNCSELNNVFLPASITKINECAFLHCDSFTSINIPLSVKYIGGGAFNACSKLSSITAPKNKWGGYALTTNCPSVTTFNISDGQTDIAANEFSNCTTLTSVSVPTSVKSIDKDAFTGCSNLTTLTITKTRWVGETPFSSCTKISTIIVPENVTEIEGSAFYGLSSMTSVTLPDSLTKIGNFAFYNCNKLPSITLPEKVAYIGSKAFYYCLKLKTINIPSTVTYIGDNAFYNCTGLTSIYAAPSIPVTLNSNVFYNVNKSNCALYVPEGSVSTYQNAPVWSDFLTISTYNASTTDIPVSNKSRISIWVNRSSNTLTVEGIKDRSILTLYDLNGKMVFCQAYAPGETLSLKDLPKRIYLVRLKTSEEEIQRKIVL
jgi:hypothetical protein